MKRLFFLLLLLPRLGFSQTEEKTVQDTLKKPDLTLEKKLDEKIEAAPIKAKKNVFYGVKVKPSFTRNVTRNKVEIEEFYYFKEPTKVNKYVQSIYIVDRQRNRVRGVKPTAAAMEFVLHGPYKKFIDGVLVQEGFFFYGTKHERWLYLDAKDKLLNKEHYHQGWYRDSDISYYDLEKKTKVQEVIPIQYDIKEGPYYQFFKNGKMAVKGQYQYNQRIGIWEEYYDAARTTIKREIQYPKDAFDKSQPYIRKEWDSRGNPIYTSPKIRSGR